nr:PREDICTED: integrin alpha-3 [Latimeria chalumnae]|eukprot:XP_014341703.1 PREDICTED: integrin alpha-3 [Latimeria chalumnae]
MASYQFHLSTCCIFWFFSCVARTCWGFNIDTKFSMVKEGKTNGSFFGFSVALHKQTSGEKRYLLLTGAPRELALPKEQVNRTGAMYYCPLTMITSDCERMDIGEKADPKNKILENMWLGVSVASQGGPNGRVMACAHRYVAVLWSGSEGQRRITGRCYVRGNNLTYDEQDEWQHYHYELCNYNEDQDGTGMCNMGIGSGFTDDGTYFGAPGSYNWQGNPFFVHRDGWEKTDFSYPKMKNEANNYIGYTVQMGKKVFHPDRYTIAAGAPRYLHKGAVYLMDVNKDDTVLKANIILEGEQVGSYFGNAIAFADLNNNGWKDVIIGAPYYFERKVEMGGAVYIYMNEGGTFQKSPSLVLKGNPGSYFGFAIANIGDVNQDGFEDIAVGAPFDDFGKVFIYHSSADGLIEAPRQVIDGKKAAPVEIKSFGYSLAGGLDVDENSYPDILIGSLSDKIALLRARPVISIIRNFSVTPKIVDTRKCTTDSCIEVKLCLSYLLNTGNRNYKKDINLSYTLEVERDQRPPRVKFNESRNQPTVYKGKYSMPSDPCKTIKLLLMSNIRDKLHPISILLNYSIHEKDARAGNRMRSLDGFPVLNDDQKHVETKEIEFQKECGMDNKCRSNLQMQYAFASENFVPLPRKNRIQILDYKEAVKKLTLIINVTNYPSDDNNGEDAHQAFLNITVPQTLLYSGFRYPDVHIEGDCKYEETVICELGNPFPSKYKVEIRIIFEASNITLNTKSFVSQLQLSTQSFQEDLEPRKAEVQVEFTVQPTFAVTSQSSQKYFSGVVMGESAMETFTDIGSPVEFTFTVLNRGEPLGDLGMFMIHFEWPFEILNGKWLLYLAEIIINGTETTNCIPPGDIVNPLNLTESGKKRRKRELDPTFRIAQSENVQLFPKQNKRITLDCTSGTARCIYFQCPLTNMSNEATVTVRARLWNSTFLEEYRDTNQVEVTARFNLSLETDKPTIKMENQTRTLILYVKSELNEIQPQDIQLWIIIVAVVAGVLLLGLIILLLWKCGFFKRASTRAMYEAKDQKAEMKIQPSETERLTEDY